MVLHVLNSKPTPWSGLENTAHTKDRQEIQVGSVQEYRHQLAENSCLAIHGSHWEGWQFSREIQEGSKETISDRSN